MLERTVNQVIVALQSSPVAVDSSVSDTTSHRGFTAFPKLAGRQVMGGGLGT